MRLRGALVVVTMMVCVIAHAQQPKLLLRASFDGSCELEVGGEAQMLSAEFVDGRDGQAIRSTVEGEPAALLPLAAADPEQGTIMFWLRTDAPYPPARGDRVRWSPVTTTGAGPDVDVALDFHQAQIASGNPWQPQHRGGAREVYSHLIPGKWYHFACTWKKSDADVAFYLFGRAQSDTLAKWNALTTTDEPWAEMLAVGSTLGSVDDLRIYDRPMTIEEIKAAGAYRDGECMYTEGRVYHESALDVEPLKGELVLEETFDEPWEENWVLEGPGLLTQENGKLRIQQPPQDQEGANHIVLWNKTPHPKDFIAEWEFTPHAVEGLCIVFFCAKGRNGESIFDPALAPRDGTFSGYTMGDTNSYHISYFRNTCTRAPNTALRKNWGFWRVAGGYDFIPLETGVTSRITLVKRGAHIQFAINDNVSIDWVDDAMTRGPVLGSGWFGLRQMLTTDGEYDNLRIWAVK